MFDVEVWASEKPLLRDAKFYLGKDHLLAPRFPQIHHKHLLFDILDQPHIVLPRNEWVMKPTISTEGVGTGVSFFTNNVKYVLQPKANGKYINIDAVRQRNITQAWVWTAKQNRAKFSSFTYLGADTNILSTIQEQKVLRLLDIIPEGHPLNVEFIGDMAIEAHARLSIELCLMPPSVGDPDPIVEVCGASPKNFKIYKSCYGYPVFENGEENQNHHGELIYSQNISLDKDKSGRVRFNTVGIK